MIEKYKEAVDEFKRVDHLYHVSLKYTRTVDVIRSVIERLISTFERANECWLMCLKEEKIIDEIPENPVGNGLLLKEKCGNEELCSHIDMYLTLRKIMREEYTKREEFRRHVTMTVIHEGKPMDIDIDKLLEFYEQTKLYLVNLRNVVEKYKDD